MFVEGNILGKILENAGNFLESFNIKGFWENIGKHLESTKEFIEWFQTEKLLVRS